MIRIASKLRVVTLCASALSGALLWSGAASAEIPLNDKEKSNGWEVTINGRVNAYLSWVRGSTINTGNSGALTAATLVGPQIAIRGNPVPRGAEEDPVNDTDLNAPRIRGGFASTILAFNIYKQVIPDVKLTVKLAFWAGIQNAVNNGYRLYNDAASVDWREQYMQLEGSWGMLWGGRRVGLYNRGGMKMNWFLMHQHGVGHPCDVDSSSAAACGHTGVGSMFPSRHAQIGYATPDFHGLQLNVAVLDPAAIEPSLGQGPTGWTRTPMPRFETEVTYKKTFGGTDELNIWANGLTQAIARTGHVPPQPMINNPGIPADAQRTVFGYGGGIWGRFSGFGIGVTGWAGSGLGTAWALGNTAIDSIGKLRQHFGYLGIANYRAGNFEVAASYGSTNVRETDWDKNGDPMVKLSVIKEVRGIGGKIAYHMTPVVFSIDAMNLHYAWHRGETQDANVISGGMLAEW
ncbi:MAG TPA: porin [Polyangiaceae bacterium]|nr:porin [Polyangiaceae bacterium]